MISSYFTETITWRRVTGTDFYGEETFDDAQVKVRWEGRRALVRNREGQEVVSEARVFAADPIQTGDRLVRHGKEWPVVSVSEQVGLFGGFSHYELAL